ncbi:hypothetical protein HCN44_008898 [Aphidius gifuensis]|uniref:Putative treble-clef zinc-finger domain-containing protein n=1 Tax=Aphidius gifuensis TaxID=684658 RepID=A0A834XS30_APHGI|nr:uncharacterized protein C2orf42 homolog [Aphidius gifuensis]XP_044013744.1 uncharacterized protein C2orf42 homolog [Aphidius gifuensis]KAF7991527.1 hypothetical protein HCN44_008898 [Aphidius gifuensis]
MSNEERLRCLLSDLGKATLRGIKKCPKCGTYNGSRGLCCKNKNCDAVFKEPGEKRGKLSTEACKLITGTVAQIYSVRVRDKGPDYRGFVQLPLINGTYQNNDTNSATLCFVDGCEYDFDMSVLQYHENNSNNSNSSNSSNNNIDNNNCIAPSCHHILAAQRCYAEAQPLTLKNSIINKFVVNNEINKEIRLLASEASIGPLVQRVSKNIMAVKCKVSSKHPLGYLHFSFYAIKLKDKTEHKYYCTCTSAIKKNSGVNEQSAIINKKTNQFNRRCVHFYACICAFASDPKLCQEFSYYINLNIQEKQIQQSIDNNVYQIFNDNDEDEDDDDDDDDDDKMIEMDLESLTDNTHFVIFQDNTLTGGARLDLDSINLDTSIDTQCQQQELFQDTNNQQQSVEIIPNIDNRYNLINTADFFLNDNDNGNIKIVDGTTIKMIDNQTIIDVKGIKFVESIINSNKIIEPNNCIQFDSNISTTQINNNNNNNNNNIHSTSVKRKRDDKLTKLNLHINNNLNSIETRKIKTKSNTNNNNNNNNNKFQIIKKLDNNNNSKLFNEDNTNLSFIKWLASITERINQTMHYQFDGKPEPLVFHVPQIFFDCLRERISCGGKKKRLPNSTTAFIRKDGVPLGTFTKYTWQITNIIHVKSIFDTHLIPLEITKSFIENGDGTYELYKRQETEIDRFKKNGNNALIKPLEIKTFLKVGKTCPNQVEPTPFLIEWIPDILPISKIGELRIRFEYGHIKNMTTSQKPIKITSHTKNYS